MLKRKILLSSVVIAALALPAYAAEEPVAVETELIEEVEEVEEESSLDISGYFKAEVSGYTGSGTSKNAVGEGTPAGAEQHSSGDLMKAEGTLKLFVNGALGENASFHAEVQAITDLEGIDGYEHHRNYTQFDYIRELYIDTSFAGWDLRLGKQQVVWGTADGVKFLDIINPTDFREWGQNTMEESRIPLWMMVAEKDLGNNDSLQIVWVPDIGRINQIPGLYNPETGDQGQPFVSLGVDTITGQYNGFLNIGGDMGKVAGAFFQAVPVFFGAPLADVNNMTVSMFTSFPATPFPGNPPGGAALDGVIQQVGGTTNLSAGNGQYDYKNPTHMFEYMGDTTFGTFDSFAGMNTKYKVDDIGHDFADHNFGIRYKKSTDFGLNFTLNYYRHWDNNPTVDMHWEGSDGTRLTVNANNFYDATGAPTNEANAAFRTITLDGATNSDPATLVFDQSVNQVNTFGTSFDYALDTSFAPIIIRGEFVYDQGSKVPEIDLGKLAYGDLVGAMTMADADIIKYVIGLDVTVAKNLFVSFQFMDTWNLDYEDSEVQYAGNSQSYGKFTANPATMSMANGFKKAEEHQIAYTLFFSKPFLESDALRVNNLFLYEQEDGGYWNRLDLEYSYADNILMSAEWNQYGGDEYGVFGQFEDQSNLQVGIKYLF